ncbi:MAG: efflux RND transporter permease subunit [Elusimicrobia bacterium]|nr:efflux RND transporter permease subunit [Elusimicrobiota bacterium]MBK7688980.1 efflux RND transporter permease subunit [Elusimicrobiota bacterium]MBK8126212.1 efflux RND transporter permease subunit [Elusimicrobiota bacterium]MBK9056565.1 efflux RND transporter permease subunit [Elusimicrobiota bacterium]MBK9429777.1 efflux RND transporter permease subunit [Elusimicrobiota bacterium]
MINKIIAFSAHNKFLVLLLTLIGALAATWCVKNVPLDALPDLSDTQVIVYSQWDRSPDIIEDQVTYPIVSSLLGAPRVKAVRGFSDFGFSYVYVIFQDGTDLYWARSRVLEYLSKIQSRLPDGVKTELGPDATGVGWVYQYALVDKTGRHDLAQLRGFQDWTLRYWLQSVPGVAEVASLGGFQKQYQVNVNPHALAAHGVPLLKVVEAVRQGNNDVGARLVEFAGAEYMVRGRGYARGVADIENIAVGRGADGTPVLVKNVARVVVGPDIRRGVADLDGLGETVGGIVVMRSGENALNVIDRVKAKIRDVKASLPEGMEIVPVYDRSDLIHRAIDTLTHELVLAMIVVSVVILLFLWHIPSALVPILTIPVSVLLAFIPMYGLGLTTNIMSLAGIAISIGVLVDGAIVEVENAYKRLEEWEAGGRKGDFHAVRLAALQEVGPSVFFSLLVIAVAFLPIFTLVDQEGRLFKPLATTKNLTMFLAAVLAITLDPAMRMLFTRMNPWRFKPAWAARIANAVTVGTYYPEEKHPVSRRLFALYDPVCRWTLRHPMRTLGAALLLMAATAPVFFKLGSEFMPPLNEGVLLYMPTTMPGISVTEAQRLLQTQDKILKSFPEVDRVLGKAGRAETATDPAPFSMMETTVVLQPKGKWRKEFGGELDRLVAALDKALKLPGVVNAWTMPIKARIDMLTTGVRTPVGIKVFGDDLGKIEKVGAELERLLPAVPGTRSVYAERAAGGYFLDVDLRRDRLARFGLTVEEAQRVLMSAVGGETVTTTIEGRERYGVSVRYAREFRDDLPKLKRVLVTAMSGAQVPLGQLAEFRLVAGPAMIRDEDGQLAGYVYVDIEGRDVGGYVEAAKKRVDEGLSLPPGIALVWSGQYENMLRVRQRLKIVVPVTLFLIFVLLYMNTGSAAKTWIVLLAVPFSMVGAVWLLWALGYNLSIAVGVGLIALLGLDAETGVFMLLYLDLSYEDAKKRGGLGRPGALEEALVHGAVKRIRPKLMTVLTSMVGLLPIMFSSGTGADMMKRVAAPLVGGLATSFVLELLVYPPLYLLWKRRKGDNA